MGRDWAKTEAARLEPVEKQRKNPMWNQSRTENMIVSSLLFSLQEKAKLMRSGNKL